MTTLTEFLSTADADSGVALAAARAFSEQVLKPIDERMMNERTVMGLIGMESGETFMQSLEAAPDNMIPARVKAWFKPSEAGIDIATPSAIVLSASAVAKNSFKVVIRLPSRYFSDGTPISAAN